MCYVATKHRFTNRHWEMEEKCMRWLERHLLTKMTDDALHTLSFDQLKRLVGSPTLFVVHIELDVYLLCRKVCWPGRLGACCLREGGRFLYRQTNHTV
jgi:hypothetical protein